MKVWDVVSGRNIFTQPANLLEASKSNTYKEGETRVSQAIMCAALNTIVIATHDHNIVFFSIDNFKITKQVSFVFLSISLWSLQEAIDSVNKRLDLCDILDNIQIEEVYFWNDFNLISFILSLIIFGCVKMGSNEDKDKFTRVWLYWH